MYRRNNINILYNRIISNTIIWLFCVAASSGLCAQNGVNLEAPNNLELNCLNTDYSVITSWLKDYSFTNTCQGDVRVTNDFDGVLPGVCGEPKFVKWIITNECGQQDSAGAVLTIDTDLIEFGFEFCPTSITVLSRIDSCGTDITFPHPYARNCFGPMEVEQVRNSKSELIESGSAFELGETEIVFIAEDECAKKDTCSFSIILINSNDLISLYCPDDEDIRVCSNIDGCGWDSTGDLIKPGTAFLDCSVAEIEYRLELPSGETMTSAALQDEDGDATGFVFPLGETRLCYTVRNSGGDRTCCFNIIVEDCTKPKLICPSNANFSCDLAVDQSTLNEWIDQAITDDNCDNTVSIRTVILDTVGVCGANERVEFLFIASDASRNENACVTSVNLTDDIGPQITVERLPDLVVECKGIVRNQEMLIDWLKTNGGFNDSHVINNCPSDVSWTFDPSTTTFQTETGACSSNVGFYDVVFMATDRCGNEGNTARARLVFEDTTPPTVMFPEGLSLDCDLNNLERSVQMLLESIVAIDSCSRYTVQSSFDLNLIECEVGDNELEVNFTASDDCGNETITTGMINLTKFDRSFITAPDDLVIRCGQDVDSLVNAWLANYQVEAKCDSIEVINNYQESQIDVCGSVHQVIWVLRDTCGATSTSTSLLTIVADENAPVFLNCPNNVTLNVDNANCTANFLFDFPRVEDCSSADVIIRQTQPSTPQEILTSGSDFPIGSTTITFTATDNCNNTSECTFNVTVREDAVCAQGGLSFQGNVTSPSGIDLTGVNLFMSAPLSEFPQTKTTDANGDYLFSNLPSRIDYQLRLELPDDVANGLSTADLVQIRNHIIGNAIFDTPVKTVAADANNDGTLSAVDVVILQNIIIGFQDTLPNSSAWKFVSKTEIDNTTLLPWPNLDLFSYPNLLQNQTEDFIGIKVGDVNYSASPPGIQSTSEIRSESINLQTDNVSLEAKQQYTIDFFVSGLTDVQGFQLELSMTNLEVVDVSSDAFKITKQNINYKNNRLIVNSIDAIAGFDEGHGLQLTIIAHENMDLKEAIHISQQKLNSEVYLGEKLDVKNLRLLYDEQQSKTSIRPNPFSNEAILQTYSTQEAWGTVRVFDSSGTELRSSQVYFNSGLNEHVISRGGRIQTGLYFYAVQIGPQIQSGKFIVID